MTNGTSPEALDALQADLWSRYTDVTRDDANRAITALRAEKEALQREVNEQEQRANENKARATAAEAQLAAAMEGAGRVRELVWRKSERGFRWEETSCGSYVIFYKSGGGAALSYGATAITVAEYDGDNMGVKCKAAAQADYAHRILAVIEPNPAAQAERDESPVAITLTYRNWRGEVSDRVIIPRKVWYGSTEWHPEPQWLLTAWDAEKNAERDFALSDFIGRPDALAARDRAKVAEGMREAAGIADAFLPGGEHYERGHDGASMRSAIRAEILAAASAMEAGDA